MNINEVYELVNFVSNKVQSGSIAPSKFNTIAPSAQFLVITQELKKWQQSQEITDTLKELLVPIPRIVPFNGRLPWGTAGVPNDYLRLSSINKQYFKEDGTTMKVPVEEVDNGYWGEISSSQLLEPTQRFPKCTMYSSYIEFLPKNIGAVTIEYIREPATPVWGYTLVNNRPVYNPATSVQFELPSETHNQIAYSICSALGMNISFDMLIGYSEQAKQQST